MVNYDPLWITLATRRMKKKDLYAIASSATIARMGKNEYVALEVIDKICVALGCRIEEVVEILPDEKESG